MQYCTGCSIDRLLRNIAADLESYSNAFLIKTRQKEIPLINAKGIVASGNPVAGYYRVHPASMQAQYNDDGILIGYKQRITSGKEKVFKKEDVIHFTLDQDAGTIWGTPRWVASLEDIKLLRKVEANVIALVYRFAMPLFHMKVGLPQTGFRGTKKEVEDAKNTIERTPMDGMLVTTEATEIKAVGAEGNALDVTGYLSYFEKRVFSALNMSDAMMGRGGAKQDASSMEELVHNIIKDEKTIGNPLEKKREKRRKPGKNFALPGKFLNLTAVCDMVNTNHIADRGRRGRRDKNGGRGIDPASADGL